MGHDPCCASMGILMSTTVWLQSQATGGSFWHENLYWSSLTCEQKQNSYQTNPDSRFMTHNWSLLHHLFLRLLSSFNAMPESHRPQRVLQQAASEKIWLQQKSWRFLMTWCWENWIYIVYSYGCDRKEFAMIGTLWFLEWIFMVLRV